MSKPPLCVPTAVGAKVTVTMTVSSPAAIVKLVGETVKPLLEVILDTVRAALPVLETTKVRCLVLLTSTLPKLSELADRLMPACVPVPLAVTVEECPEALCVKVNVAVFPPEAVGVKVTVTVWGAPPAAIVTEVGLTANCPASVPDAVMLETVSVPLPVLNTVNIHVMDESTLTLPKARVESDNEITAANVADA